MNLRTHTAYPELHLLNNKWIARLYDSEGKVVESREGIAGSNAAAREDAKDFVASVEPKYRLED